MPVDDDPATGVNRRKMEDERRQAAEKEAAPRRATEQQILEDAADHLITVWNARQSKRMPMLFSPTIGAALTAGYWFLRARCPACRTTGEVDLRCSIGTAARLSRPLPRHCRAEPAGPCRHVAWPARTAGRNTMLFAWKQRPQRKTGK